MRNKTIVIRMTSIFCAIALVVSMLVLSGCSRTQAERADNEGISEREAGVQGMSDEGTSASEKYDAYRTGEVIAEGRYKVVNCRNEEKKGWYFSHEKGLVNDEGVSLAKDILEYVPLEKIVFSAKRIKIAVGEDFETEVRYEPANATCKDISIAVDERFGWVISKEYMYPYGVPKGTSAELGEVMLVKIGTKGVKGDFKVIARSVADKKVFAVLTVKVTDGNDGEDGSYDDDAGPDSGDDENIPSMPWIDKLPYIPEVPKKPDPGVIYVPEPIGPDKEETS